jgi:CRP/FNR family transcriptional regulator
MDDSGHATVERSRPTYQDVIDIARLRRVRIFQEVSDGDLVDLMMQAEVRRYFQGDILCPDDLGPSRVFVLSNGCVRLCGLSRDGREITLGDWHAGDIVWLRYLEPMATPASLLKVIADSTVLYSLPSHYFREFLLSHPTVAVAALGEMSTRLVTAYSSIQELALHDVKTRLSHVLADLARLNGQSKVVATHAELATRVGTTQEWVTKLLHRLRRERLIAFEPHHRGIVVLDSDRLISAS